MGADTNILVLPPIDVKLKSVRRDKEGHFMLIKGTINKENIITINIYASKSGMPNFIKHTIRLKYTE